MIVWGAIAEPDAYMDRDGYAAASLVLTGTRIVPNQLVNQRRAAASPDDMRMAR